MCHLAVYIQLQGPSPRRACVPAGVRYSWSLCVKLHLPSGRGAIISQTVYTENPSLSLGHLRRLSLRRKAALYVAELLVERMY